MSAQVSSIKDPFSTFLTLLWTEKLVFILGLEFRLVYLLVLGDVMLISGIVMLVLRCNGFICLEGSCGIDARSAIRIGDQAEIKP